MDVQEDLAVNNVFDNEKKEVSNSMNKLLNRKLYPSDDCKLYYPI